MQVTYLDVDGLETHQPLYHTKVMVRCWVRWWRSYRFTVEFM